MKKTIITVIATIAVLILCVIIYISSGLYNISQLDPHNGITKWMIRKTKHSSIDKRMTDNVVPANLADTASLILGFQHYNEMCTDCHGAPGVNPDELSKGLYPKPPLMYKHKEQEDPQEFFWIIKNGIKMTSMPAYGPTHDDKTLWAITAFVTEKLTKMTPEEYREWTKKYPEPEEEDDDKPGEEKNE